MATVRHGERARDHVMLRGEEVKAGAGPGRTWWAGWGPPPSAAAEERTGCPTQNHRYLLGLGFNLPVGESFQQGRRLDPQELNKWKPR